MKYLFFLLVLFPACCKETTTTAPPAPVSKRIIEGRWSNLIDHTPNWDYEFYYGLLRQTALVGDTPVATYEFPYAIRNDTIFIGGDISSPPRQWRYQFELDSLMQVSEIGVPISQVSWLVKR